MANRKTSADKGNSIDRMDLRQMKAVKKKRMGRKRKRGGKTREKKNRKVTEKTEY